MGLKRPIFLISGTVIGTVGVLSYVPGSLNASPLLALSPAPQGSTAQASTAQTPTTPTQTPTTPTQTPRAQTKTPTAPANKSGQSSTKNQKKATAKAKAVTAIKAQANTSTQTQAPAPVKTQAPTATRTIAGSTVQTPFGRVQVQITVQGTKITNAAALQTPQGGRSSWINQQAVPYLIQETLAAQSANIQGVTGATYTSQSWVMSLQAALAKM